MEPEGLLSSSQKLVTYLYLGADQIHPTQFHFLKIYLNIKKSKPRYICNLTRYTIFDDKFYS